jgi:hypothetical protein
MQANLNDTGMLSEGHGGSVDIINHVAVSAPSAITSVLLDVLSDDAPIIKSSGGIMKMISTPLISMRFKSCGNKKAVERRS